MYKIQKLRSTIVLNNSAEEKGEIKMEIKIEQKYIFHEGKYNFKNKMINIYYRVKDNNIIDILSKEKFDNILRERKILSVDSFKFIIKISFILETNFCDKNFFPKIKSKARKISNF